MGRSPWKACEKIAHYHAAVAAHPYEFEVPSCRKLQFTRCCLIVQACMLNDLVCYVFDSGTLQEINGTFKHRLLVRAHIKRIAYLETAKKSCFLVNAN